MMFDTANMSSYFLGLTGIILSWIVNFINNGLEFWQQLSGLPHSKMGGRSCCALPDDLMLEILSRVPARSLIRFRCVCKQWNSLFHDSHFVTRQLNHALKNSTMFIGCSEWRYTDGEFALCSFEIEEGKVVASNKFMVPVKRQTLYHMSNACNGLIAFCGGGYAYVANPCTREWLDLPKVSPYMMTKSKDEMDYARPHIGLGFSTSSGKYKVVRFFNCRRSHSFCEVLTVGTDRSWRLVGKFPYIVTEDEPAYANGCIYWSLDVRHSNVKYWTGAGGILIFDVSEEKMKMMRLPPCDPEPYGVDRQFFMSVFEGCVCLIDWRVHLDRERGHYLPVMHIHALESSEGPIWSKSRTLRLRIAKLRTRLISSRLRCAYEVCMSPIDIKNGKLLLYRRYHKWRLHDLHTGACPTIRFPPDLPYRGIRMRPFVCAESIVPIDRLPE